MPVRVRDVQLEPEGGVVLRGRVWEPAPGVDPIGRVIVVHGLGEHGGRYGPWAAALVEAGYAVAAFDQRGHGRSSGRRGVLSDVDVLIDDLAAVRAAVVRSVPGAGEPVLHGHSMGGLVALRALQRGVGPWSAAIVSAPWLGTALPVPGWKRRMEPLMRALAPRWTLGNGIRAEHLTRDPDRMRAWRDDPLVHDRVSAGLVAAVEKAQREVLGKGLPADVPVLVLIPGDDPVADAERTRRWVAGASAPALRVAELEGVRHEPHNDVGWASLARGVVAWLGEARGAEQGPPEWVSSSSGRTGSRGPAAIRDEPSEDRR